MLYKLAIKNILGSLFVFCLLESSVPIKLLIKIYNADFGSNRWSIDVIFTCSICINLAFWNVSLGVIATNCTWSHLIPCNISITNNILLIHTYFFYYFFTSLLIWAKQRIYMNNSNIASLLSRQIVSYPNKHN